MTINRAELKKKIASIEEEIEFLEGEIEDLKEEIADNEARIDVMLEELQHTLPDGTECTRCKVELREHDLLKPKDGYVCGNCGLFMTIEEICEEVERERN